MPKPLAEGEELYFALTFPFPLGSILSCESVNKKAQAAQTRPNLWCTECEREQSQKHASSGSVRMEAVGVVRGSLLL